MVDKEDDEDLEIAKRHVGKLNERMEAAKAADADTDEVEIQDEPPADELEVPAAGETRKDRRANRYRTVAERAAAAEARATALEEQLEVTRRERAERPVEQPGQRQNPVAHIDARIRANAKRYEDLNTEWVSKQGKMSAAEETRMKDLALELDVEKMTLVVERRDVLTAPARDNKARMDALASRAPDVYENPRAMQYAQAVYNQHLARGAKDSIELHDLAMQEAREAILGKRPAPDAAQRQRASSMGGGSRGAPVGSSTTKISMPKGSELYKLACAQYPNLEPAAACQKWANTKGKAFAEKR